MASAHRSQPGDRSLPARPETNPPASLEEDLLVDPAKRPDEALAQREQLNILWNLLHLLPANHREMVVLRYILDWPIGSIAAHLDMNENTVSVNLRRILQRLRKDWPIKEPEELSYVPNLPR